MEVDATVRWWAGIADEVARAGELDLLEAYCSHRRGHLAHGYVNAGALRITCPLHHSSYSLETGDPRGGPSGRAGAVRPQSRRGG
ncbi:Rieske (2Fe-2S) protein [Streptomyces fractus]|uniref:Rieske (2Fe-2S) protein n=1 Tax=Streptomyces fractus TaxID=641806 RepID=UPI003CE88021